MTGPSEFDEIQVLPMAGPQQWIFRRVDAPGQELFSVEVYTPYGHFVFIMTQEHFRGIGEQWATEGEMASSTDLEIPEDWTDPYTSARVEIEPEMCPKAGKPHKAHKWNDLQPEDTTYYKCRGNW